MTRRASRALLVPVAALLAAAAAAAAPAAGPNDIGKLTTEGSDTVFTAVSGRSQLLTITDSPIDFGINEGWKIRSDTTGTTIINNGTATYCDAPILLFISLQEWVCKGSLRLSLGDLDDRLVSTAINTKDLEYFTSPDVELELGVVVDGGSGRDRITTTQLADELHGGSGNDTISAGSGDDTVFGDGGDDLITGGGGTDGIDGGDGSDTARWTGSESVVVTLNDTLANDGRVDEEDTVTNVENVDGSGAGDTVTGNAAVNKLQGLGGADWLDGREGNDWLIGGAGNDRLYGFSGDDKLEGQDGSDRLYGASGGDYLIGGAGNDTLDAGTGSYADHLVGGAGDDVLKGGLGVDLLEGGDGADTIYSHEFTSRSDPSVDIVKCGTGIDTVYLAPEDHADSDCENVIRS